MKTQLMRGLLDHLGRDAEEPTRGIYRRGFLKALIGASFGGAALSASVAEAGCWEKLKPSCNKCDAQQNTCPLTYVCTKQLVCGKNTCSNLFKCTKGDWCTQSDVCATIKECDVYDVCQGIDDCSAGMDTCLNDLICLGKNKCAQGKLQTCGTGDNPAKCDGANRSPKCIIVDVFPCVLIG
jgi:hypothetical protein